MNVPTGTIELKKYSLRQTREGTIIAFVVHPSDAPVWLSSDPIGTVYAAALVPVSEGGEPSPEAHSTAEPSPDDYGGGTPRRKLTWDELPFRTQSGIRCNDPAFTEFKLRRYEAYEHLDNAEFVRMMCGAQSRSEIIKGTPAGDRWHDLDVQFQNWKRT